MLSNSLSVAALLVPAPASSDGRRSSSDPWRFVKLSFALFSLILEGSSRNSTSSSSQSLQGCSETFAIRSIVSNIENKKLSSKILSLKYCEILEKQPKIRLKFEIFNY